MGGIPLRLQLFGLIIGFIVVVSLVSFNTSYQFILNDKESSLRELQLLRVEQVRSKVESRIEILKGQVLESGLRLVDSTRAKPELDVNEWQYLVADTHRWISPATLAEQVPQQAQAAAPLAFELSADKEWVLWSQQLEVITGASRRSVAVQAKFRSSLIFKSIAEFQEGGLDVVMVRRNGPNSYDLIWGKESALEKILAVDKVDASLLAQVSELGSREVMLGDDPLYLAWGSAQATPWTVVSAVPQSTLVAGLSYLVANQGFWVIVIVLLAVIVSIWFARRFSKPIEILVEASQSLETGDFSTRVSPGGPTELRSLGAAFNHMGQSLEDREAALKSAQDALIQNEKLAAVGTLSAGIAHEVKNPLAGILGNADLLAAALETSGAPAKTAQYVETIRKETKRCREIVDSLMRFSRQESSSADKAEVDLELVAWDVVNLVEHSLNMQGFRLEKQFSDDVPVVLGVANQIQQVLLNMVQNAGHAMESTDGKTIVIGVDGFASLDAAPAGSFIALDQGTIQGPVARVWIRDEGTGMSPEIQRRIFEPFFTTKEAGKGTGLGLAVTMGILGDHGVRLSIESAVGAGTTFYMDFGAVGPRSEAVLEKIAQKRQKASGGAESAFDVGASAARAENVLAESQMPEHDIAAHLGADVDLGVMGDDKPISIFEDPAAMSEIAGGAGPEKTVTNFSVRKPKLKG